MTSTPVQDNTYLLLSRRCVQMTLPCITGVPGECFHVIWHSMQHVLVVMCVIMLSVSLD